MERSGSYSDSSPSDIGFHILRTLNDEQMVLVGADSIMMAHKWAEIPTGWVEYPRTYFSPGSGMLQQLIVRYSEGMRCSSPGPVRNTWILDVGLIMLMTSPYRV